MLGSCQFVAVRLDRGQDLRREITRLVQEHRIGAGFIASAVGCLQKLHIRLAEKKGKNSRLRLTDQNLEVLALSGTLSLTGLHLHISVADSEGHALGGHVLEGCEVYLSLRISNLCCATGSLVL